MTLQTAYYLALGALSLGAAWQGTGPMKRTILTLWAVAFASLGMAALWPTESYSYAMIVADAIGAWIILYHPAGKWQSVLGLSFVLQIGLHIGRILNGDDADINLFYEGLSGLALLQLALIGGWSGHEILSHYWRGRNTHSLAVEASRKGVG